MPQPKDKGKTVILKCRGQYNANAYTLTKLRPL